MKPTEQKILQGILADLDYWCDPARRDELCKMSIGCTGTQQRRERGHFYQSWKDATERDGLIRIDVPKWLGHTLTESQRVMAGRSMARLEDRALIERFAMEGLYERLTHVRLTDEGLKVARELQTAVEPAPVTT